MLCVWGLYNLLYVYLYLQYIHVYIYIFNMTGIMYQLYDMCVCVVDVVFGMFWGDDVWGTLAPPARIVEPVARDPAPLQGKL